MTISVLLNLLIASLLSALLYIILKYFQRWKIYNLHGLTFNYVTASCLSFFLNFTSNKGALNTITDFAPFAFLIGMLFIIVFYIAALTAQNSGITVTSIAGKMSMIIPITAGIFLYHDTINFLRIAGILTALAAVILSSYVPSTGVQDDQETQHKKKYIRFLPLLLFIGSGFVDTSIKLSEHYLITPQNQGLFISFLFGSAGIFGLIASVNTFIKRKIKIELKSVAGGILLGVTNYYSLDFLIGVLATPGIESSLVFAMTNVIVVLFSTFFAIILFREKLSLLNIGGLGLAILSIIILSI